MALSQKPMYVLNVFHYVFVRFNVIWLFAFVSISYTEQMFTRATVVVEIIRHKVCEQSVDTAMSSPPTPVIADLFI